MQLTARVDFRDAKLGLLRKGQSFEAPDQHGMRLIRLRCAVRAEDGAPYQTKVVRPMPDPVVTGGEDSTSSASPPVPASLQTTANESVDGDSTPEAQAQEAAGGPGRRVLVTNNTWELCSWADVLVAIDRKWWEVHHHRAYFGFPGEKISWASYQGVHRMGHLYSFRNSGAAAIAIASHRGAALVTMVGYDCSKAPNGKVHWHGDHKRPLGNAGSIDNWPDRFAKLGRWLAKRSTVVQNASRRTALELFPRIPLETALDQA